MFWTLQLYGDNCTCNEEKTSFDNWKVFFQHEPGDFWFNKFCQNISSLLLVTHLYFDFLLNNCIFFIKLFFIALFFRVTAKDIMDKFRLKICSCKIKLCKESNFINSAEKQFSLFFIKAIKRLLSTMLSRNSS